MKPPRVPSLLLAAGAASAALAVSACVAARQPQTPPTVPAVTPSHPPAVSPSPTLTVAATQAASATPRAPGSPLPTATPLPLRVVAVYPHDRTAFTQGLVYADGVLYESTGLYGQSSLRRVALESGAVEQAVGVAPEFFAEGLALVGDRLFQLTWQSHVGFIYERDSLARVGEFSYAGEGWGLTTDGARLIMSDGTATLRFLDPQTLSQIGQVEVRASGVPVARLNELEWVEGEVWANIWQTDFIARIDPASGAVLAWVDLSGLLSAEKRAQTDVLNGIAYDAAGRRLFVTGKLWPYLFEIEVLPPVGGSTP